MKSERTKGMKGKAAMIGAAIGAALAGLTESRQSRNARVIREQMFSNRFRVSKTASSAKTMSTGEAKRVKAKSAARSKRGRPTKGMFKKKVTRSRAKHGAR